jgi:hypothetical protein
MRNKAGKKSSGQRIGGQYEGPEKTYTGQKRIETTQIEPSQPKKRQQPLQQQKMLHQEPALPTQLGVVCVSDDGPSKQETELTQQVQQLQLLPPLHPQQPAKSPSGDVGTPGFRSGQTNPYRKQAEHRQGLVHGNTSQKTMSTGAVTGSPQTLRLPTRKDRNKCGTNGKPIIVETNHFALDLSRV